MIKALKYKVTVQDDLVHLYTQRIIDEIYLPEYGIIFNKEGGCFVGEIRNNIDSEPIEIAISKEAFDAIQDHLKAKHKFDEIKDEIFESLKIS